MKLEITTKEEDFVTYQLYTSSKSESTIKKLKNGRLGLSLGSLVLGVYFYITENISLAIYFGFAAIVAAIFYPKYFKWRYKQHYEKHIREHYKTRFGEVSTLEFTETDVLSKDKTGEAKMKLSEIEVINEISTHFFLKFSTNVSLIIPKRELIFPTETSVRAKFEELDLVINNENDWKW
jgi:hypothetical protein